MPIMFEGKTNLVTIGEMQGKTLAYTVCILLKMFEQKDHKNVILVGNKEQANQIFIQISEMENYMRSKFKG